MLRRFVTYQLILAVAVGQLLCCCTGRLLAAPATAKNASAPSSEVAPPPQATHSCCSHRQAPKPADEHKGSEQKQLPHKPGDKCPCKEAAGQAKVAPSETTSTGVTNLLRLAASVDLGAAGCVPHVTLCSDARVDCSRGKNTPRLSTDDILFAHHNLRC